MKNHSPETEREAARPTAADDSRDDVVSLKPLLQFLAAYRRVIGLAVVGTIVVWLVVLLALLLILPAERTASMQVRLLFEGASEGRYPNGTTFSPADIVATPVLSEVYRMNDLQRFGPYDAFKESITILQTSLEQDLLTSGYTARLADTKLTPTDRARLEDEFRKKLATAKDPVYALTMRRSSRVKVMPAELSEKILNDALAVWAQQAKDLKGAVRFNVAVVSSQLLNPQALDKDFLIAADDLRLQARRAADVAQGLMVVPGAASFRTSKEHVSLSDVDYALGFTLRTEIEPLVTLIQQSGWSSDPPAMQRYLRNRINELRLSREATRMRIQTIENALDGYIAAKGGRIRDASRGEGASGRQQSPDTQSIQLSDSFLDRLIEMSTETQAADVAYRQSLSERLIREGVGLSSLDRDLAYYEQLEKSGRPSGAPLPAAQAAAVKQRLKAAADAVQLSIGRLVTFYDELSNQQLSPAALYVVSTPFATHTRYALTLRTVLLSLALAVLLALVITPVACAYHRFAVKRAH